VQWPDYSFLSRELSAVATASALKNETTPGDPRHEAKPDAISGINSLRITGELATTSAYELAVTPL
jgi:hypothetical protein